MESQQQKYHFVLVHGACHGAWCWYKLIDRLQKGGHLVTALDMAGAGQHPADPDSIATYEQYNQPVIDFFDSLPKEDPTKVALIGHSMGGLTCMLLMERFSHKIGLVIFIAAVVTPGGASLMDSGKLTELLFHDTPNSKALEYNFGEGLDKPPTSFIISKPQLKDIFYTDWNSEDVMLASILVRSSPVRMLGLPITFSKEKYGQVPTVYVKYLRDKTMPILAQDWIIENLGPFKEVTEIDGGHFDFHLNTDAFTQLVYKFVEKYFVM